MRLLPFLPALRCCDPAVARVGAARAIVDVNPGAIALFRRRRPPRERSGRIRRVLGRRRPRPDRGQAIPLPRAQWSGNGRADEPADIPQHQSDDADRQRVPLRRPRHRRHRGRRQRPRRHEGPAEHGIR